MGISIQITGPESLEAYTSVPIAFTVRSRLRVELEERGLGGIRLVEEPVNPPYVKDYDESERPPEWAEKFNVRNWAFILAMTGDSDLARGANSLVGATNFLVGAATVASDTPGVFMLEGRRDLSVLWDIRVHPDYRGQGIGAKLFSAAADWSRARGCSQMKIETQNINVPACHFYARMGCELGSIHRYGYAATPFADETMLFWFLDLKNAR